MTSETFPLTDVTKQLLYTAAVKHGAPREGGRRNRVFLIIRRVVDSPKPCLETDYNNTLIHEYESMLMFQLTEENERRRRR